ncbi:MAG: hypothetical protein B9S32_02715 [Verrucomicrobia bacterium Tous-C9LFEB]|nr:MAG: hypothetical protein B9S32_02715 [Verrucomicrobia bacterium Tous-C9LFEB]
MRRKSETGAVQFRYIWDPIGLASIALYACNRLLLKPHLPPHEWFFRGHFNDLLLVPAMLPFFLATYHWLGLRPHHRPPSAREIIAHVLMWSLFFEVLGPRWLHHSTGDRWDVIAYAVGGAIAWALWNHLPLSQRAKSQGLGV